MGSQHDVGRGNAGTWNVVMKAGELRLEDDNTELEDLIEEGEHQQLDFKFEIADAKKIARTLVAFANTDGGKLLIGVKDNGGIAGIRSDEEYYMLQAAADMYCKPPLKFSAKLYSVEEKLVLVAEIAKSDDKPHKAPDKDGNYKVYIRKEDQNLLANRVILKLWDSEKRKKAVTIRYSDKEKLLLDYLLENDSITLSKYCKISGLSLNVAERIIVNFLLIGLLEMDIHEKGYSYFLADPDALEDFENRTL